MTEVGFIGGFGRSGSTLLERVIAELPGVCALGEVLHLWQRGVRDNERCACGKPFHDCEFWMQVGQRAFGGWQHVDVAAVTALGEQVDRMRFIPTGLASSRLSARRALELEYAGFFSRVYAAAAEVSGAGLVVDSSKNASTAFALRSHPDIALRVLHIVRDSRGVAYSWTKSVPRPEAELSSEQPLMDRYPPWMSAMLWNAHNFSFTALGNLGTPVQRVFYEAFLRAPAATLSRIAGFLGVEGQAVDTFLHGDTVTLGATHQVAGNPMRFRTGELRLRRDDDWRAKLPAADRRLVASLTAPLMLGYGYLRAGKAELR